MDEKTIHVAEYLTELPPAELLAERLHRAIAAARESVATIPEEAQPKEISWTEK